MAAILGEANLRSEELRRVASTAGRDGGGGRGRGGGGRGRGGGRVREGLGRGRGGDSVPGHYGHDNNINYNNKRVVEDDVDDNHGKNNDYNMKRRRRRWNDRDDDGSTANNNSMPFIDDNASEVPVIENPNKVKANFALSGALATDSTTGNARDGITLKFSEPPEARVPNTRWRLYVFRKKDGDDINDGELIDTYHISKQSSYLFGRERKVADIPVDHSSLSKQHAVLQYRALPSKEDRAGMMMIDAPTKLLCRPYLMDLESTNGTFINGVRLDSARYYELKRGDVITFGASTREYVLLTEQSSKTGI
jgi:smad nuclear-interacting protein 1